MIRLFADVEIYQFFVALYIHSRFRFIARMRRGKKAVVIGLLSNKDLVGPVELITRMLRTKCWLDWRG